MQRTRLAPILITAVSVLSSGCGNDHRSSLPSGDDLDAVIGHGAGPYQYRVFVSECLQAQGIQPSDEEIDILLSRGPFQTVEQGAVAVGAVDVMYGPVQPQPELDLRSDVRQLSYDDIEYEGHTYEGGCDQYAEAAIAESEVEALRLRIADTYSREALPEMRGDPDWLSGNAAWAECMATQGHRDFDSPELMLSYIIDQATATAGEAQIQRVRDMELQLQAASARCLPDLLSTRAAVRERVDAGFLERHEAAFAELLAEVDNLSS